MHLNLMSLIDRVRLTVALDLFTVSEYIFAFSPYHTAANVD
jgi:hypothetical protein